MKEIGSRIKERRKHLGLTLREAATRANTTASSFRRWEEGDIGSIKTTKLEEIAQALRVTPAYLMGWEDLSPGDYNGVMEPGSSEAWVPMLGAVSAGTGVIADQEYGHVVLAPEGYSLDFAVKVKGDSMINARIYDGDTVYIKAQEVVDQGDIAAVVIEDEVVLKRVYYYPGRIELRSENPLYTPLNFEEADNKRIRVLGKAVILLGAIK